MTLTSTIALILPALAVGYFTARSILVEQAFARIHLVADAIERNVGDWVNTSRSEAEYLTQSGGLAWVASRPDASQALTELVAARPWIKAATFLTVPGGRVAASSDAARIGRYLNLSEVYVKGSEGFWSTKVYSSPIDLAPTLSFSAPLGPSLVVVFDLKLERLKVYGSAVPELGSGARLTLINDNGFPVNTDTLDTKAFPRGLNSKAVMGIVDHQSGTGIYPDHRNEAVMGDWRWMPQEGIGIIAEIEEDEALQPSTILGILFLLIALASVVLSWLLARRLSASFSRPLEALTQAAMTLTERGEVPFWPQPTNDEVGSLNRSLRTMAEALERHASDLETRVAQRTADLSKTIEELNTTREQLVESGKMALLGTLVAGISHELNSPLAAILSSAEFIEGLTTKTLVETLRFHRSISERDAAAFLDLLENQDPASFFPWGPGRRDLIHRLRADLTALGHEAVIERADQLVDLGLTSIPPGLAAILVDDSRGELFERAWKIASLDQSVRVIRQAAEKASKVILALRIYARQDEHGAPLETNLAAEIDLLLEIYYSSLKQGVEVIRRYEPMRPLPCQRDRLNQVWANLINNAVHAMEGRGRLTIGLREVDGWAEISVEDTGPGIAPENRHKIFSPFFTTKAPGIGTGLGLSISHRIVIEHHGVISFESNPGSTVFLVRIPYETGSDFNRLNAAP